MKKIILGLSLLSMAYSAGAQQRDVLKNNMKFYPLSAFAYGGVGFGVGYERILDNEGKFGLHIPVHIGLTNSGNNFNGSSATTNTTFMASPGVKFYPAGQRRVTYGIGASVFGSIGNRDEYVFMGNGARQLVNKNEVRAGMLLNNSIQFNIGQKFNLGLDLGLGPSYLNQYNNRTTGESYNEGIEFMASFGFHLGFRF